MSDLLRKGFVALGSWAMLASPVLAHEGGGEKSGDVLEYFLAILSAALILVAAGVPSRRYYEEETE